MILLDENISRIQREQLLNWKSSLKQIGYDFGRKGIKDDEIIPLLQKYKNITFFTRDSDFFRQKLCHPRYCIVFLDVEKREVEKFIRQLYSQPFLKTQAKRMGKVIRATQIGVQIYERQSKDLLTLNWK